MSCLILNLNILAIGLLKKNSIAVFWNRILFILFFIINKKYSSLIYILFFFILFDFLINFILGIKSDLIWYLNYNLCFILFSLRNPLNNFLNNKKIIFTSIGHNYFSTNNIIPVKSYDNADIMRLQILKENKKLSGIYRWEPPKVVVMGILTLVLLLI